MKPVCLVTGAGGRLGQKLCADLARDHDVVAVYHDAAPLVSSQTSWRVPPHDSPAHADPSVLCVRADLQRREDIGRIVEVATARHGCVDSVVHAAADIRFHGRLVELWESADYARAQLALNAVAPIELTSAVFQTCWKDDVEQNGHRNRSVVTVSSISGIQVSKDVGQGYYAASKAALNVLTMYLSLELAPYGVRANALCPSKFDDARATGSVVGAVRELLDGTQTGQLITGVP